MRILWIGDLANTGFGTVTKDCGRELLELGADVRFVSQNDLKAGLPEPFLSRSLELAFFEYGPDGVTAVREFIPRLLAGEAGEQRLASGEPWGDWRPDAVILLGDYYGTRDLVRAAGELDIWRAVPTWHYVPVEGHDLPPQWREMWSVIRPVAMSRFGQDEIERVTGERPPLVYHGVDAVAFHPVSASDPLVLETTIVREGEEDAPEVKVSTLRSKTACKWWWGLNPAVQMVLRTDRFMPRKGYPALLRAMTPVLAERPATVLVLHCKSIDHGGDMLDLVSKLPADVRSRVLVPDWGPLPREALVALYNAADLYVSTSAEGFGLTIAEALACGVPAVGLDYSAVPEVIGPAGSLAPVGTMLDNEYGHRWALPDEAEFAKRVAYLLDRPHKRVALGQAGPGHIRRSFSWRAAAEAFLEVLARPRAEDVFTSAPEEAVA